MRVPSDVRQGLRYLRRRPLLVWLSVGTLGVGLGVASALFGVINALYLRPLPADPEKRVIVVRGVQAEQGLTDEAISRHDMVDLLSGSDAVGAFGGLRDWGPALLLNDQPEPMSGIVATAGMFDVFGVKPHVGRLFTAADDAPGRNHVVLLTYDAWTRRFSGDRAIVGRGLNLDGESFTIIGVLPRRLSAPRFAKAELWAPLSVDSDYARGRGHRNLTVYARLAPGAGLQTFASEILGRARTLAVRFSDSNRGWTARAIPLIDYELGAVLPRLLLLGAAAALLLLMACANMASLIFAEAMSRGSELGLRAALGGSASRLFRQLFVDHLLLCLAGGASAVAIAWALLAFAGRFEAAGIPRLGEIHPDATIVVVALGVSIVLALAFAAISVFQAARSEPADHIRASEHSVTHSTRRWVSHALVASQVALAFVLLWSALSFGRAYHRLATTDPGFDTRGISLLRLQAVGPMNRKELVGRSTEAVDDLPLMPGIASATLASSGPLFGGREDMAVATDSMITPLEMRFANVDASFFDCLHIPILAGRRFTRGDDGRGDPVVIVSRSLANRLFPHGDAVGKQVLVGTKRFPHTVIGVAGDADEARVAQGGIDLYIPFAQDARRAYYLIVRGTNGNPVPIDAVTERLRQSLPGFMVLATATLDDTIGSHLLGPRLQITLLLLFAFGAAVLATVAVFDMVTLVASKRAGEMGLRLALGATPRQAQTLLLRAVAGPVAVAIVIGALIVIAGIPHVQAWLSGIRSGDPLPPVLTVSLIVVLTIAACWRNVREIARREPIETIL